MNQTVEQIAKEMIVEEIVGNITKNSKEEEYRDLVNDIYLTLLEKSEETLKSIYERNQIRYFITRIVMNNLKSKTSPFFYAYKRYNLKKSNTDGIPDKGEEPEYG